MDLVTKGTVSGKGFSGSCAFLSDSIPVFLLVLRTSLTPGVALLPDPLLLGYEWLLPCITYGDALLLAALRPPLDLVVGRPCQPASPGLCHDHRL